MKSFDAFLLLTLALLCSAVAYLIYYRLMKNLGPTRTLTITFLMPVFGIVWGAFFLKETVTFWMVLGTAIVLAGTYFVIKTPQIRNAL